MGIRYRDEDQAPDPASYLGPILSRLKGRKEKLLIEPGRSLVGNAGVLLTRVDTLKPGSEKNFAIVDAAMNDLMRPALYDAWHDILPLSEQGLQPVRTYEIVGPICESGDFLGHERNLSIQEGDLLAILSAGAYGMAMSSNYNTRPRAAEVMVDGAQAHLIRPREEVQELFRHETLLP
jgi:diaminopimelate decarboxylase